MGKRRNHSNGGMDSSRLAKAKPALSRAWQLAYLHYAPNDIEALKNYKRWLKRYVADLNKLIHRLEKTTLPKIKMHYIRASIDLLLMELKDAHKKLEKAVALYSQTMDGNKKFLATQAREFAKDDTYDANEAISLLTDALGGQTNLAREFEKHPEIIPPGITAPLNADAIRKRNFRIKKRKS